MKPADTVAHIRPICDVRVIEAGKIRKKGPKGTLKRDANINEDKSFLLNQINVSNSSLLRMLVPDLQLFFLNHLNDL